jgi:hypothetical protein
VFAIIHDSANRRVSGRGNFDEIKILVASYAQSFLCGQGA